MSHSRRPEFGDDFWTNATNQLMRALFDVFLLAGEPLIIDNLTRFVALAPEKPNPHWHNITYFGDVVQRAQKGATSDEDKRICRDCVEYWTVVYPGIASATRSGITLGFTAMANALSGRGIHDLISSTTNITPELILSGLIVILDLPIKDCGQGGLLVQAAWKYLFDACKKECDSEPRITGTRSGLRGPRKKLLSMTNPLLVCKRATGWRLLPQLAEQEEPPSGCGKPRLNEPTWR